MMKMIAVVVFGMFCSFPCYAQENANSTPTTPSNVASSSGAYNPDGAHVCSTITTTEQAEYCLIDFVTRVGNLQWRLTRYMETFGGPNSRETVSLVDMRAQVVLLQLMWKQINRTQIDKDLVMSAQPAFEVLIRLILKTLDEAHVGMYPRELQH